jgi:isopentenyl phosphate kinase
MATTLNQLKPFIPVLEAMKRDSGLVDHVRDYLKGGGSPDKSIKEKLKLDEDFEYDPSEAMSDPESDSAKLQNAHIDQLVQSRVNGILGREKQNAAVQQKRFIQKKQEVDFVKKHGMTPEEFGQFKSEAQKRSLNLDDIYYLLNKDRTATNVANNTKQDMLNQMKNVRTIPTSASDSNNQGTSEKSPDDKLFEGMLGLDSDVDNLFG